ncbi:Pentatricopeptide repeat-containing protein At1g63400 [Durusdinium trenchii]|uniref:Pentatricopeptide repeat-containing protein At1g63400 n=1 Tax=Durusdinium trenchii TaxID=1381693 RepID=A0ABP0K2C9_9DINO
MEPGAGVFIARRNALRYSLRCGLQVILVGLCSANMFSTGHFGAAYNGIYSSKVARSLMKTRRGTKTSPQRRAPERRSTTDRERKKDERAQVDGQRGSQSQSARRAFLLKRLSDPKLKTSELQSVATELVPLLRDPRDFTRLVSLLASRRQPDLMLQAIERMDREFGPSVITYSSAIHGLSKSSSWQTAIGLLRQLEDRAAEVGGAGPNLITYNSAISTLARARRWTSALELFNECVSKETPTESTYSAAMTCCRGAEQWETALHLNEDMLGRGLRGNLLTWTSLIQALERYAPVLAVRAYGRMKRAGFQADEQVHDAVLRACAAAGLWKRAIFILNKIIEARQVPSATAYSNAVAACGRRAGPTALRLFEEMKSRDLTPTPSAYVGVMDALAQQERWDSVLGVFEDLKATPGVGRIPYAAYAFAMEALEQQRSEDDSRTRQRGMASKQLKLFDEMCKSHKYQPSGLCHNLAAKAHADRYEAVQSIEIIQQIVSMGFAASGATCEETLKVRAFSRDGEVTREQAQMLYEVGIKGYITENQTALAERMLERMKEEELPVEQELYRFLVTESNSATAVTHAFEQLDAVGTDPTAGTAAMKAYVELAQWERSLGIFQELQASGALALKGQSLGTLERVGLAALSACSAGGGWKQAFEVLEQLRCRGLVPSAALYEEALRAAHFGAAPRGLVRSLLLKMMASGKQPSQEALRAGQLESKLDQVQEMQRSGFTPDEALVKAAIAEAKQLGDREAARELSLQLRSTKTGVQDVLPLGCAFGHFRMMEEKNSQRRAPKKARRKLAPQRRPQRARPRSERGELREPPQPSEEPEVEWEEAEEAEEPPASWEERVHDLATTLQNQNEALAVEKGHVHSIKASNNSSTGGMQSQLNDVKRYFGADIQRMLQEFQVQSNLQQAENVRLQQQVTSLKGEKTSVHQQIIAMQRRIEELEEELGHE